MDSLSHRDEERLAKLQASMYDWHLSDIKAAAESGLPRLAFLGIAAWLDTIARINVGRKQSGRNAWRKFIQTYMPPAMRAEEDVKRLYDGLRNALSHEYGTRGVLLTDGKPEQHWQLIGSQRVLNLESFIAEIDAGYLALVNELHRDAGLRAIVLPSVDGLLSPVEVSLPEPPLTHVLPYPPNAAGTFAASATSSEARHVIERADDARRARPPD